LFLFRVFYLERLCGGPLESADMDAGIVDFSWIPPHRAVPAMYKAVIRKSVFANSRIRESNPDIVDGVERLRFPFRKRDVVAMETTMRLCATWLGVCCHFSICSHRALTSEHC
jgi:hypothetical protein